MNNGINHGTQPQKGTILLPTERRSDQKLSHDKANPIRAEKPTGDNTRQQKEHGINHGTQPQKGTILLPTERRSDQKLSHNKAEKKQSRSGQKSRPETTPGSKMNNGINHGTQPQKGQSCSRRSEEATKNYRMIKQIQSGQKADRRQHNREQNEQEY
jgi:hypothetical protein